MKNITNTAAIHSLNGGKKIFICPWDDYSNANYFKVWVHAIAHANRRGWFDLPKAMIKVALAL